MQMGTCDDPCLFDPGSLLVTVAFKVLRPRITMSDNGTKLS